MDTLKFYECEPDQYLYEDVIITPFFSPGGYSYNPSLIGNISINKPYTDHFKFSKVVSRRCYYADYEEEINHTVIFGGFLFDAYGHFILESLSFMWFIQYLNKPYDIYFAFDPSGECELKNYQKDVFNNLGVKNRIFFVKKTTRFHRCYIPPSGYALGSFFTKIQEDALAIQPSNIIPGKKTYISRSKYTKNRGCSNEDVIERILVKRGWNVIYPERLTFKEQLSELSTSELVFCISGSALHSIVFLKDPKQKFIVIPRGHGKTYNILAKMKCDNYYLLHIDRNIIKKGKTEVDDIFEINMENLVCLLVSSNDFCNLSAISTHISKVAELDFDWRKPQTLYFKHDITPEKSTSAFYWCIYNFFNHQHLTVNNILFLLKNSLAENYMLYKLMEISYSLDKPMFEYVMKYIEQHFPEFYHSKHKVIIA